MNSLKKKLIDCKLLCNIHVTDHSKNSNQLLVIIFEELTDEIASSSVFTLLTANMSTVLDIVSSSDNVVTIILTQIIKAVHIIMMQAVQTLIFSQLLMHP